MKALYFFMVLWLLTACVGTTDKKTETAISDKQTDPLPRPSKPTGVATYEAKVARAIPNVMDVLGMDWPNEMKYQRIMEVLPDKRAFDTLHYQLCDQYINGIITYDQYFQFTNDIIPVHRKALFK